MSLQTAAAHLLNKIDLPPGAANVFPLSSPEGKRLIVWIDVQYLPKVRDIPKSFEGYAVNVEQRPSVLPQ